MEGIAGFNGDGFGIPYASPSLAFAGVSFADPLAAQRAAERESWDQAAYNEMSSLEKEMAAWGEVWGQVKSAPGKVASVVTSPVVSAWESIKNVPGRLSESIAGPAKDVRNILILGLVVLGILGVARIVRG